MIDSEKDKKKKVVIALVKSPSRDHHIRKGHGFSQGEIKAAGKTIKLLKELNIKIDYFRKSVHKANVDKLKELKPLVKKGKKKKKPYIPKEKRVKPKKQKIKKKKVEIEKEPTPTTIPKPSASIKEKTPIKQKTPKSIKEKTPTSSEPEEMSLTKLSGLGAATVKKFNEVGVNSVEDLIKEDPKELSLLISGVSEDRINKWVEEGKNLLNQ